MPLVRLVKPFFDGKETFPAGVHNLPDNITLPTSAKRLSKDSPEAKSERQVAEAKAKVSSFEALSAEVISLQEELAVVQDELAAVSAERDALLKAAEPTAKVVAKAEDKK